MRYLGMQSLSHEQWLAVMGQSQYVDVSVDRYNNGPLVTLLEHRVSELFAKPNAMYFNKGTTCQLALMKAVCESKKNNRVVVHPQSHIAQDEQDAYQALMGLEGVVLGGIGKPFDAADLYTLSNDVAVLVVELPLRRAGFKLTPWDELLKMRQWCDEEGVHFHMDGARLWESAPFYGKSFEAIAALFDSVYVSLYKGIGAVSGALLLGDDDLLSSCAVWRDRLGSNMWTAFPSLITALEGLDKNLPQIPDWVERTKAISEVLIDFKMLVMDKPECNGFQIKLKAPLQQLNAELLKCEQQFDMVLCKPFERLDDDWVFTEIQVVSHHAVNDVNEASAKEKSAKDKSTKDKSTKDKSTNEISDVEIEMFFAALLSAVESGDDVLEWSE